MRYVVGAAVIILPLADLAWNLTHFQSGLVDIFGLLAFARGLAENGAWPATPYFPAGYPLLLLPFGLAGNALVGGYVLSACGLMLALWALYRLVREFEGARWVALTAIVLGWLAPVYRMPAGSPSVDALYTGLGMWFIAAAVTVWRRTNTRTSMGATAIYPTWARFGLCIPAILLPLLRYHALILIGPVLLVMLIRCRGAWRPLSVGILAAALATGFNYATYYAAYGEFMQDVTDIQIRFGVEFDYHVNYDSPESMCADYHAICTRARSSSVIADYGAPVVLRHTLRSLYLFLRRPAVVLALCLSLLLLLWKRELPAGIGALALWIPLYCMALSPAYYTPRSAALPVLAAAGVSLIVASWAWRPRFTSAAVIGAAGLLLVGYSQASRYARLIYRERSHFAQLTRQFEEMMQREGWRNDQVVATDVRVIPVRDNPWGLPFPHTEMFWTDDPAVRPGQTPGIIQVSPRALAEGAPRYKVVIYRPDHPRAESLEVIMSSQYWKTAGELEEMVILKRVHSSNGRA